MSSLERSFTIWGESIEELEEAAGRVESYMSDKIGKIEIHYQVMRNKDPLPWDTGFVTEEAFRELQQNFIVTLD